MSNNLDKEISVELDLFETLDLGNIILTKTMLILVLHLLTLAYNRIGKLK